MSSAFVKSKIQKRSSLPPNRTSEVWNFFVESPVEEVVHCIICSKTVKCTNSSTSGMLRHLKICHPEEHAKLAGMRRQRFLEKGLKEGMLNDDEISQLKAMKDQENEQFSATYTDDFSSTGLSDFASPTADNDADNAERSKYTADGSMDDLESNISVDVGSINGDAANPEKVYVQLEVDDVLSTMFMCNMLPVEIMDNHLFRKLLTTLRPGLSLKSTAQFREKMEKNRL